MHYHVFSSPKKESIPIEVFNFESSQQAIDKVMQLIESFGSSKELLEVTHAESDYGRFSTIIVPHVAMKIVLHECKVEHKPQTIVDNSKLN